jgi:hypothetical protein
VVVVVVDDGVVAVVSAALGGGVLAAMALGPVVAGGAVAMAVAGVAPGVIVASAGRVAYQPAAASAASAIRPTAIAAGATEPLRRTTVRVCGAKNGASPSALIAEAWPTPSLVIGAAAELLTSARRAPRRLRPRSQDGIGANMGVSESCGASPLGVWA